jgi:CheY-like chemotaxis protein
LAQALTGPKIAVVDDQHFAIKPALELLGYRVTELGDINTLDQLTSFEVVLCDIQGVGAKFLSEQQGAFVIKEIRRQFPEKYIVAFSGASLGNPLFKQGASDSDFSIRKDEDLDAWVQLLDDIVDQLLSPRNYWYRIRKILVSANLDTSSILDLEDAYVRALEDPGSDRIMLNYRSKANALAVSPEVKDAALRVVTSAILEAIRGSL